MRSNRLVLCLIAFAIGVPASAPAQQSTPAPDAVDGATAQHDDLRAERDRLHLLLLRSDVRHAARDRGIDLRPIHDGIETLDPAALAQVAPYARALEAERTQSAITISTTTIIIVLLLVILLVLIT